MAARTFSVGVDVDHLKHYYRIHGHDDQSATGAAFAVGVPRFMELFEELGIPATFYCVSEDLQEPGVAARLREAVAAGHEIGNHSWHHRYDLTRLPDDERRAEVERAREQLEEAAGAPVVGFRAPGYTTSPDLLADVAATGHTYDSSVFPCVPYYSAKAAVMGLMALRGRRSQSILGPPAPLLAPRGPYPVDPARPYRRAATGLLEYPISVAGGLPMLGTAFTALGERGALAAVALAWRLLPHVTVEFHAVDLLALADDGLDPALATQPDLKTPVAKKRRIFKRSLGFLAERAEAIRLDALTASLAGD
ncbi:MAG: polysaccharide deacetylase family protein [bacterium]